MADIARRFPQNPILRPSDVRPSAPGLGVECLLNPGVFRFADKTWLLVRVAERPEQKPDKMSFPILDSRGQLEILEFDLDDPRLNRDDPRVIRYDGRDFLTTLSHLRLLSSTDGVHFAEDPSYAPLHGIGEFEAYGLEDCRVSKLGETYYLTFTQVSEHGVGVGLRSTTDWRTFSRHGMILPPHNKDCALFEERINGKYHMLHRPSSPAIGGNYIWLAESTDLEHWGRHRCVAHSRPGMWDSARIGAGAAPIRTELGWLEIYHGATEKNRYCLGALLLDLEAPWRVLRRSREPIMEPLAEYEQTGFFGNVVFTNGHVVDDDTITLYYGASDTVICGAQLSIQEILASLN
jgi:predicted GH43/DUF377 family glycosyl hydrolase